MQFPAFMRQNPSPPLVPSSVLLPLRSGAENNEILLATEESEFEEKMNEIRKANSDVIVIGKATLDSKEEDDGEAEEDDADNVEESDGDEFEQETG